MRSISSTNNGLPSATVLIRALRRVDPVDAD